MKIITNNNKRPLLSGWELTESERKQLDYIAKPDDIETWSDCINQFFRYRGQIYDTNEFVRIERPGERTNPFCFIAWGDDNPLLRWDGIQTDSFFSGVVIRYADSDCCNIVVGLLLS